MVEVLFVGISLVAFLSEVGMSVEVPLRTSVVVPLVAEISVV